MYPTYGAHQISSVTELRTDTNDLLEHVEKTGEAVLLQRNNEPVAFLLGLETYRALRKENEALKAQTRAPRP